MIEDAIFLVVVPLSVAVERFAYADIADVQESLVHVVIEWLRLKPYPARAGTLTFQLP
jgi:hypothetical protein